MTAVRMLLIAIFALALGAGAAPPARGEEPEKAPGRVEAPASDAPPEPSPAAAEMLKSMREKGILSSDEYDDIYRRQAIYEYEEREREKAPPWFEDWTVGGDIRVRMERIDRGDLRLSRVIFDPDNPQGQLERGEDNVDFLNLKGEGIRDRMRLRFRLGAERRLGENWTVGFRIATAQEIDLSTDYGEDVTGVDLSKQVVDYRSSNVTLGDYFAPKGIYLDRAYLQLNPEIAPALKIVAGKFENPFRSKQFFGDMLVWDDDINPEGAALKYRFDFIPETWWADVNVGFLVLDEVGSVDITQTSPGFAETTLPDIDDRDPYVLAYQIGTQGADATTGSASGCAARTTTTGTSRSATPSSSPTSATAATPIMQNPAFSELGAPCARGIRTRSSHGGLLLPAPALRGPDPAGRGRCLHELHAVRRDVGGPPVRSSTRRCCRPRPSPTAGGSASSSARSRCSSSARCGRSCSATRRSRSSPTPTSSTATRTRRAGTCRVARKLSDNVTLRLSYYSARVASRECVAIAKYGDNTTTPASCSATPRRRRRSPTAADFRNTSLQHRKRIQIDLTAEF